ncbi:MAG: HAMP domain-containing histidine kinase [Prevotella sp.]|nr:HAMP domain-containing histidine kinase [Prevotella sp.]
MKYNILGIVVLVAVLSVSIQAHLIWPSIALGVLLLWLCASLYGRMSRMLYAYRETEKENEKLHTRLAEAERQLQYLRQLTENVDTALFVCTTDGRIDWMNHAATRALKAPPTAPEGASIDLPSRGRDYRSPLGGRRGGLEGAFLPPHILQAITDHAEVVDGCALSTVLLRIDGQRRLVVALKDVSMLMQRQEMEAWQQLIRVLTHEIMNSLTPIISISETLSSSPSGGGQEGAEAFAVINRRCHALLDFVENYRQLTRIKTPVKTTFPVSELLEHIKGLYPQVKTQSQPVREGSDCYQEPVLYADRSQLEQVLINLIKNAYESGATLVELTVHSLPSLQGKATGRRAPLGNGAGGGSGSTIRIKDNGCGMSPDVVDHAFIPFFTTKPSGTGIGLSLCRQIILKHGGTIRVESLQGKGTTFIITLPKA